MRDGKKWVKWWCDAPSDPKVQMVPYHLRWAFPALLALAKKSGREGYLEMAPGMPYPDEALATWCGMSLEDTREAVRTMLTVTLLETVTQSNAQCNGMCNATILRFKKWDKRQKSDSYNRVKRYRERAVTGNVTGRVTTDVEVDVEVDVDQDQKQGLCDRAKTARFTVPAIEEIQEYCTARKNTVDPVKFHAHYTANGWKVGKNPMKNWKAAVVTWERT